MALFLLDVNLPYKVPTWKGRDFVHVLDINPKMSDNNIWEYALKNNLTIISKDADFSNRIMFSQPPPKVIHLKVGNMKLADFITFIDFVWIDTCLLNQTHKLVNVIKEPLKQRTDDLCHSRPVWFFCHMTP